MTEPAAGSLFRRKSDGVMATVVHVGGGAHTWIDLSLETGRKVTVSLSGLKKKYEPTTQKTQEDDDD